MWDNRWGRSREKDWGRGAADLGEAGTRVRGWGMGCDLSSGLGQAWVGTWMKMETEFRTGTRVGQRTWLVTKCRVRSRGIRHRSLGSRGRGSLLAEGFVRT